jgi:DNA-binding protein HU-beta
VLEIAFLLALIAVSCYNKVCLRVKILLEDIFKMANKQELIAKVAESADLTKKDAEKAVNAVFESVSGFLAKGEKVQLIGFGTFETRERAAREGRNPQTGAAIKIAATTVPAFKAGKALKDAVK